MASESKPERSADLHTCHICQLSVVSASSHEGSLQHRAARQVAAAALDRWRAHMAAEPLSPDTAVEDTETADETVTFCDACAEAFPSAFYPRHLTSKAHLVSALDEQVFEELARRYLDEEDLCALGDHEDDVQRVIVGTSKIGTTYTCHICALQIPVIFKNHHYGSSYHQTRAALATAAARRISASLHAATPIRVDRTERNIKYTELLKAYTGIDITEKKVENEEVPEKGTEEKASQIEVKKRLTAKQYFTDILPFLQHTEALHTIIIDDTEYVTIKTINDCYMRVHVTNFNGLYNSGDDVKYQMRCLLCHGYNNFMSYSSENNYDKLHVMSLGHIRHVLTPIDNIHGIRKIDNGNAHCVLCNRYFPEHNVENHVFNDIHHTAALAEALERGKKFKESKEDLKIVIYAPPVDGSNSFMSHPPRNRCFPHNVGFGQSNVNVCYPEGGVPLPHGGTLFAASTQSTGFGNTASNVAYGARPASNVAFGASPASTGGFSAGASPASNVAFGASPASTGGFSAGASPARAGAYGASPANTTGVFNDPYSGKSIGLFGGTGGNSSVSASTANASNTPGSAGTGSVFSNNGNKALGNTTGFGVSTSGTFGKPVTKYSVFGTPANTGAAFNNTAGTGSSFGTFASTANPSTTPASIGSTATTASTANAGSTFGSIV